MRVLDRWANVQWQLLAPRESALTGTRIPYSNPREGVTDGAVPYQRRPAVVTQRQVRSSFLRVDRLYGRRRQRAATGCGHARRSYRRRTAGESQTAEALRAEQGRGVGDKARGTIHHRQHPLAPVLPERVRGWRVHARRRLRDPRQQLQHDRRSWQLHAQRVQADRERVPGAAPVRPPGQALGDRRMARGHRGRLLRHRHRNTSKDDRTNYSFKQPYASAMLDVRPSAESAGPRRRSRVLAVGSGAGRRQRTVGRRGLHAGHAAGPGRHGRPTCTRRARRPSTGGPPRATRGAAATTARRFTTTQTATTSTAFGRSTTM